MQSAHVPNLSPHDRRGCLEQRARRPSPALAVRVPVNVGGTRAMWTGRCVSYALPKNLLLPYRNNPISPEPSRTNDEGSGTGSKLL